MTRRFRFFAAGLPLCGLAFVAGCNAARRAAGSVVLRHRATAASLHISLRSKHVLYHGLAMHVFVVLLVYFCAMHVFYLTWHYARITISSNQMVFAN